MASHCVAVAASLALCVSCAANPAAHARVTSRTVAKSLIVRSTLAAVSNLSRPVRWALAMDLPPAAIREVIFSVDGHVVGISRRAPFACCIGGRSYLAGLSTGPHTFVCTVLTTDRRTSRETVTAKVLAPRAQPHRGKPS